ncbi:hypothetical protein VPH35_053983 [Triticum aestivum]
MVTVLEPGNWDAGTICSFCFYQQHFLLEPACQIFCWDGSVFAVIDFSLEPAFFFAGTGSWDCFHGEVVLALIFFAVIFLVFCWKQNFFLLNRPGDLLQPVCIFFLLQPLCFLLGTE